MDATLIPLFAEYAAAQASLAAIAEKIRVAADPLIKPPPPVDPNAMPTADIPGWKLLMAEDFLTDIPMGGVRAALRAKGWEFYDGFKDTKKVGLYSTDRTALTDDGNLIINLRTDAGQPLAFCALPTAWNGQLYGRYEVRFRTDTVPGFKIAWLLWPKSGVWTEGEVDFPEAGLGGNIWGFNHKLGNPSQNQMWVDSGVKTTGWHTAVIEWTPKKLAFILDGKEIRSTVSVPDIPKTPMRWTLQCETNLEGTAIDPNVSGNIEIAYVRVHSMVAA